ncbi:multidrug DMT transporter permease [Bordetella sp. H567]|uniref:DMT family transporter n=1 Tax=Bordetella sp. H567 TaxID=1697043 RepID=UPI00081C8EF5|nr:DMT family transporter [Bordetella sp. H567]AOB31896.1 multidrug DMT transporter permease [Bordetella sp. H567]
MNSSVATPAAALFSSRAVGFCLAALGAILFSGKAIVVKFTYEYEVDAVTLIAFRMLFSLPFFAFIGWRQSCRADRGEIPVLTRTECIKLVLLGLIGYYLSSFLDFLGLRYISVGLERLILFLAPTLVLLITAFWLKRPIAPRQWLALLLSYLGVVLVFAHDMSQTGGGAVLLGSAFVFASAFTYALYLIGSGELVKRVGAMRLTAYAMSVSSIACLVQFFVMHPPSMLIQPAGFYGLSLIHATVNTVLPVFMIMSAVSRIGPPLAAQLGMLGPVSVLFLAYWFLGEPVTAWQLAGTAFVLAGVFVLTAPTSALAKRK